VSVEGEVRDAEVVVVGAGFAGVAAARELQRMGIDPLVLEARDRLGGRTWFDRRLGTEVELGGTWVHPFQSTAWAEVRRLGLPTIASPVPQEGRWIEEGRLHSGTADELWDPLDEPMRRFARAARTLFPEPYAPLTELDALAAVDHRSVADGLADLALDPGLLERARALWSLHFCAPCEEGALTQALRWLALSNGDWLLLGDICETIRLERGTRSLIEAIAEEADIRPEFGRVVDAIAHDDESAVVHLADGSAVRTRGVIVTVPIGALGRVRFEPGLPARVRDLAHRGQASRGVKVWARLREPHPDFCALAAPPNPLTWLRTEHGDPGGTLVVGFAAERRFDPTDRAAVEAAVRTVLPDADVVASTGHDWVGDVLSGETWPMLRPGQLTSALPAILGMEGRLRLAGSYAAEGWMSFIDGALESGMRTARSLVSRLRGDDDPPDARPVAAKSALLGGSVKDGELSR
jgi:monoamine oxidase